ncbi:MAG TPA: Ig-like domain repeat protein [Usitatibacter sp.]|jgi:hypothetical protein|nr:Ig-like domain repeat protein [Usitatibacter sp.]
MHHGIRTTAVSLALGLALFQGIARAQSLDSSGVSAVPTYEAAGLYWNSPPGATSSGGCEVKFRASGASAWTEGLAMVYDTSANQCRGSLVNLTPGTTYEAQLNLPGQSPAKGITFTTWSNRLPVAKTVNVGSGSGTLDITEGGSPSGYVVYDGGGSAVLDAQNNAATNVSINASYVIVRGITMRGAQQHGVLIDRNQHDVVIEDNDISGWGRTRDGTWGTDMDSGIRAICQNEELTRVTIQRNRIHDPRYSANSWAVAHPAGPQGVTFSYCGGNNVFRHNEIYSSSNHFNDGMGGEDNFSTAGFPNRDSDVYGNKVSMTYDDGLEIEGGDENVRVWGNYIDRTGTGVASTVDSVGPLYVWRNVWDRNEFIAGAACDSDQKQPMFKSGSSSDFGNGRRYLFHNTMLQRTQAGCQYGLGGGAGVGGTGDSQLVHNTVSMNNIYNLWKPNGAVYQVGSDNTFQNDMYNGSMGTAVVSGINAAPKYGAGGNGNADGGLYQLAAGAPGYDQGVRIPNFNDRYNGSAPDVGAAEAGDGPMVFGLAASAGSSIGAAGTPAAPSVPTGTGSTGSGSGGGSSGGGNSGSSGSGATGGSGSGSTGSGDVGATMDSSSFTIASGSSVTFTARLSSTAGTPTGSVSFRANGATLGACASAPLSGGVATCTTSLGGGSYAITGVYGGDATHAAAQAGPITQTVTGAAQSLALPTSFGMDSSSYTINAGDSVTFTATIPGDGGTAQFQDNGAAIGSCASVAVSNGIAHCTTTLGSVGAHAVRAVYSGNGGYSTGVAGPITQTVKAGTSGGGGSNPGSATVNVQGLWWGAAAESGWGVNLTQQGNLLFATWFTYDVQGNGQWLVMSAGALTATNTWSGTLYRTRGPSYGSATFDPSQVSVTPVGSASFTFSDANHGTFNATVDGMSVSKPITREIFSASLPTCVATPTSSAATNYQDLWWRVNGTESGWGLNITHQGDTIFLTWFTYDDSGNGVWLVASGMTRTAPGSYVGTLYRTTGPAFNAPWDASRVTTTPVGTASLSFSDGNDGTFSYSVNGVTGSKPITRQVFASPKTTCN